MVEDTVNLRVQEERVRQMIENCLKKEGFRSLSDYPSGEQDSAGKCLMLKISAVVTDSDKAEKAESDFEHMGELLPPVYLKGSLGMRGRAMPREIADMELGNMKICYRERQFFIGGREIPLPRKEMDLLTYLAFHRNTVVGREELLENIWGYRYDGDIRTVDTHIKRLRKKLGEEGNTIMTVRGVGYRLVWMG